MRGLSEEDIKRFIRAHNIDNEHNWIAGALLEECHELDSWLPIENAPKDRRIRLFYPADGINRAETIEGKYQSYIPDFDYRKPTHYKELSDHPTCERSADT